MGWDVGKSLLNNPHIAVTSTAAQIHRPSVPLENQLWRHDGARERRPCWSAGDRKETWGRSEKAMEKRRMRKTEEEISKGRMWERNRMWWRGRKSTWMEGEDDEGQGGLCYSFCWGLVVPTLSSL